MRILFVKLSSMGDVIHALPALSDVLLTHPDCVIDWVIDQQFAQIASMHPAVGRIIITNHRIWRKKWWKLGTYRDIARLFKTIRQRQYTWVIDGQGNFKSALIACCAHGRRAGFDQFSVREPIAHWAYQEKIAVSKAQHAILRQRQLFSAILRYKLPTDIAVFQIQTEKFVQPPVSLPQQYWIFIPNASWETKLWPQMHWQKLIALLAPVGVTILLPWGNEAERARALRLAAKAPHVQLLPRCSLLELGFVIEHADAIVSVDTGLSHLAAALGRPVITLYGATDARLIGTCGDKQQQMIVPRFCAPCQRKHCHSPDSSPNNPNEVITGFPPCMAAISPERVAARLLQLGAQFEPQSKGYLCVSPNK